MSNVGYATLQIIPSAKGFGSALARETDTQFASAGKRGGEKLSRGFMPGLKTVALGIGGAFAASKVTNFVKSSLGAFTGFQNGMAEVFTLLPGISKRAMDGMTSQALGLAKNMGVLPEKVVPALYQAISSGIPKGNVFEFLETAQRAAKGGVTSLETAVDGLSSVTNAYGKKVLSAAQASDLMFTTVRLGKTNFEQLSGSLFNVAPIAASIGVKFRDVSAALAAMTVQGTPTSVAATQLRGALGELSKSGQVAFENFKKASGKTFPAFIKGGGNLQQALAKMETYAKKSGKSVTDLFGSIEAGQAATMLTGRGTETFAANITEMGKAAGATDGAYKTMANTVQSRMERVSAGFATLKVKAGSFFSGAILRVADGLSGAVRAFRDGLTGDISSAKGPLRYVALLGDRVGAFSARVRPVLATVVGVADLFWGALSGNGTRTGFLRALNGPTIRAVMGFANGLRAAWAVVQTQFLPVLRQLVSVWVTDVYPALRAVAGIIVTQVIPAVLSVWRSVARSLTPVLTSLVATFRANVIPALASVWAKFQEWLPTIRRVVGVVMTVTAFLVKLAAAILGKVLPPLIKFAGYLLGSLIRTIGTVIGWVVKFVDVVLDIGAAAGRAGGWVKEKFGAMVGFVKGLPGRIKSAASGMWDGIKYAFRGVLNTIIGWWNGLDFTLPKVHIPGTNKDIGGFTLGTPDIPLFAKGGIALGPTLGIFGEAGPEAVIPLDRLEYLLDSPRRQGDSAGGGAPGNAPLVGSLTLQSTGDVHDDLEETMFTLRRIRRGGVHV